MPMTCYRTLCIPLLLGGLMLPQVARGQLQLRLQPGGGVVRWNAIRGPISNEFELTPAQVESIPGAVQIRLEQAQALSDADQWDEAVDLYIDIMLEPTDGLVELGSGRYISLRDYCHCRIARFPPDVLQLYRSRVDARAETWYRQGVAQRDRHLLRRVVDELFCSSWGDDALFALGELALEAGDYTAARKFWDAISPLIRSPAGRPARYALAGVDLDEHWSQVAEGWQDREVPPDWLAYPDTDLELPAVRGRLVLLSLREGNFSRAKLELDLLERRHPEATARIGGRSQPLVAALTDMMTAAEQWPAIDQPNHSTKAQIAPVATGQSMPLPPNMGPAWSQPVSFVPSSTVVRHTSVRDRREPITPTRQPLRYHPIVMGELLLYSGSRHVRALHLADGRPAVTGDGVLFRQRDDDVARGAREQRLRSRVVAGTPRYTLSAAGGSVYVRAGSSVTVRLIQHQAPAALDSDQVLVGLDLNRDGLLTLKTKPEDGTWAFEGAPIVEGADLYVAMRHSDVKPRAYVACFDRTTGRLRWRTPICAGDTPASGQGDEISNSLLTLVDDTIFFNTNLGAVAAVEKHDGRVRWVRRYDRATVDVAGRQARHFRRELAPCIYHDGAVMVAPTDTPLVLALDAATGKTLWVCEHAGDTVDLLGVAGGNLIASGDRCSGIDVRTGQLRFQWPEAELPGFVGRGRGCLAADEIFWPTRHEIYVLDANSGAQTRPPIDISEYTDNGANLVAAGDLLVLAGSDQLMALGPVLSSPTPVEASPQETAVSFHSQRSPR